MPLRSSSEPKALRLLLYLIQNPQRLITKQELFDQVWSETAVTDSALSRTPSSSCARPLRRPPQTSLRRDGDLPTIGYRFIAPVTTEDPTAAPLTTVSAANAAGTAVATLAPPEVAQAESAPTPTLASPAKARRSTLRLAAIVVACLAAVATVWLLASRHRSAPIRSLAVLPLDNLSGDPSQEYFADGMTDELITELARIPNLRVVSRTSVMADKGSRRPLPDIARQLDVDAIVEGSIVRSGDRIRITAQLIDARTDRHLWAQSFEGPASDVLSLQDSVAQQIATQARLVLAAPSPRAPVKPAAHDAYLRGRYFFNKQDLPHSLESFQQAIALDPAYASAYAGYASALDAATAAFC